MKNNKKPIKIGLLGGFIAALCCIGPLILILLGVGTASTVLSIGKQSPYFLLIGLLFLGFAIWFYYFKRKKEICDECQSSKLSCKKIISIIILSCAIFILTYIVLIYIIIPWLASKVTTIKTEQTKQTTDIALHQATMKIEGMWCASCAVSVEYALKEERGVIEARVDYDSKTGVVIYDPEEISLEKIKETVKPYTAVIIEDKQFDKPVKESY